MGVRLRGFHRTVLFGFLGVVDGRLYVQGLAVVYGSYSAYMHV